MQAKWIRQKFFLAANGFFAIQPFSSAAWVYGLAVRETGQCPQTTCSWLLADAVIASPWVVAPAANIKSVFAQPVPAGRLWTLVRASCSERSSQIWGWGGWPLVLLFPMWYSPPPAAGAAAWAGRPPAVSQGRGSGRRTQGYPRLGPKIVRAETANCSKTASWQYEPTSLRTPLNASLGCCVIIAQECFGPVRSERYRDYAKDIHLRRALFCPESRLWTGQDRAAHGIRAPSAGAGRVSHRAEC